VDRKVEEGIFLSEGTNIVSGLESGRQASGEDDEVKTKLSKLNIKQKTNKNKKKQYVSEIN
jgi:hypothetical protein